jgi:hypothetical protein
VNASVPPGAEVGEQPDPIIEKTKNKSSRGRIGRHFPQEQMMERSEPGSNFPWIFQPPEERGSQGDLMLSVPRPPSP